ncbi:glycosyltransferase family 87 protein [Burkholderia anthina]|uniref:glycosyltransferase family 87 protein n=1 Tax=Burkholderia anthina TaxID=179879 RepID=UPI001FC82110|nr:glycosyltransferase family 87 protein [Burkholderia anthina]
MGTWDNALTRVSRTSLYASAALVMQIAALAIWGVKYYGLDDRTAPMVGIDFGIFWAAARVAIEHGASAVFSAAWMVPVEAQVRPVIGYAPFPYPPTFLLAVLPFGTLKFAHAVALFTALGVGVYGATIAHLCRDIGTPRLWVAAAFPGVALAIYAGQNSLLTAAAAGGALVLIESAPVRAGACLAFLAIKPQFGVLFPVALVCGRHWRMLFASGAFGVAFLACSVAVFGVDAWSAFASYLPEFGRTALHHGDDHWAGMPTLFAMARMAGLPVVGAHALHLAVAIPAAISAAYLWAGHARFELRAAALVVASLLVQPYMMSYDLVWLGLPIALLLHDSQHDDLTAIDRAGIGLAWMTPVLAFCNGLFQWPFHVAPIAMIALLVVIMRRHFASRRQAT